MPDAVVQVVDRRVVVEVSGASLLARDLAASAAFAETAEAAAESASASSDQAAIYQAGAEGFFNLSAALGAADRVFATKAAATAALPLPANAFVVVMADESRSGSVTIYRVNGAGAALDFINVFPGRNLGGVVNLSNFVTAEPDQGVALATALAYADATGAQVVRLDRRETQLTANNSHDPILGDVAALVRPGVRVDGSQTVIKAAPGDLFGQAFGISAYGSFSAKKTITAAFAAGATVISLNSVSGIAVDSDVLIRAWDNPYDTPEALIHGWNRVIAVNPGASTITLKYPLDFALSAGALAAAVNNKHVYVGTPITNEVDGDWRIVNPQPFDTMNAQGTPEYTIAAYGHVLSYAKAPHIGRLVTKGCEVGGLAWQYVEGGVVDYLHASDVTQPTANRGTGGRCAECTMTIHKAVFANCYSVFFAETRSRVRFGEVDVVNASPAARPLFYTAVRSQILIDTLRLRGVPGFYLWDGADVLTDLDDVMDFQVRRLEIATTGVPSVGALGKTVLEEVVLAIPGTARATFKTAQTVTRSYKVPLTNSMSPSWPVVPAGALITQIRIYVPAAAAGAVSLYVTTPTFASNLDLSTLPEGGKWKTRAVNIEDLPNLPAGRQDARSIVIFTAAAPPLAGLTALLEVSFVPDSDAPSVAPVNAESLDNMDGGAFADPF